MAPTSYEEDDRPSRSRNSADTRDRYDRSRSPGRERKQKRQTGFRWKGKSKDDLEDGRDQERDGRLERGYNDRGRDDRYRGDRYRGDGNKDGMKGQSRYRENDDRYRNDSYRNDRYPPRDSYRRDSSRDRDDRRDDHRDDRRDRSRSRGDRYSDFDRARSREDKYSRNDRGENRDVDRDDESKGGGESGSRPAGKDADEAAKPKKEKKKEKKRDKPAMAQEAMIVVYVNDRLGTKAAIACLPSDPIKVFKMQVAAQIGREPHEILLKRQGERPFKDQLTLEDYGVSNGVQLDLEVDTGD